MRTNFLLALLCLCIQTSWAQTAYWTSYNFTVKPGSDATVLQLANDYFALTQQQKGFLLICMKIISETKTTTIVILLFGLVLLMQWEISTPLMLVMPGNCF